MMTIQLDGSLVCSQGYQGLLCWPKHWEALTYIYNKHEIVLICSQLSFIFIYLQLPVMYMFSIIIIFLSK